MASNVPIQNVGSRGCSGSDAVGWLLQRLLVTRERRHQGHVQGEGDVDQAKHDDDGVPHERGLRDVPLGHEDGGDLLPPEDRVRHEDADGEDVEEAPPGVVEDLELQRIDVADADLGHGGVLGPEQVERQEAPEVHEAGGRADVVRAKLSGVAEAELEEVDGHEGHEHEAGDGEVQHAEAGGAHQLDLHVPGPLQADNDVQDDGEEDVLLDDVGGEAEAGPVQADVEVAVAVEVVGPFEDVQVSHGVDDNEDKQENGTAGEAVAVVGDLDVGGGEDGGTRLVQHRQEQRPTRKQVGLDVDQENARVVVRTLDPPVLRALQVAPRLVVCDDAALVLRLSRPRRGCLRSATSCGLGRLLLRTSCGRATCTDHADDRIRGVLAHDVRGVDHVELRGGILACEGQDGKLAARVLREEAGDVQDLIPQDYPAISFGGVFGHLLLRVTLHSRGQGSGCLLLLVLVLVLLWLDADLVAGVHAHGQAEGLGGDGLLKCLERDLAALMAVASPSLIAKNHDRLCLDVEADPRRRDGLCSREDSARDRRVVEVHHLLRPVLGTPMPDLRQLGDAWGSVLLPCEQGGQVSLVSSGGGRLDPGFGADADSMRGRGAGRRRAHGPAGRAHGAACRLTAGSALPHCC
mmetsp:Transcript_54684/g.171694  ORF Transcript_54684/g.171694 Transcript_54684/m.171694 type:complete len:633 (+) Transcript_54684:173-2071(+)